MVSSSTLPAVKVVEQCRVSPAIKGQAVAGGHVSIPLTFWDVFWVGGHPVERLFFYRWPGHSTTHFADSALTRLKRSLSPTLRLYYPLAGRLRPSPPDGKLHIHCTDGDAVTFTLAECDGGHYFEQLAGDHARRVEAFRPLIPELAAAGDGGGDPLMALQVTVFPGAGLCVGVSTHHAASDGSGVTSFIKSWASACRLEEDAAAHDLPGGGLPVVDRALVSDPNNKLYETLYGGMDKVSKLLSTPAPVNVPPADKVLSTFHLKRVHINELRRQVSEQRPPPPPLRYSTFVLTSAYVLVCLLKARGKQPPPPPPQGVGDSASFIFAVDCRARLRPPLPAAYFGNCLGVGFMDARWSDLIGEGGVGHAAEAIARAVAGVGEGDQMLREAEEWIPKSLARLPGKPLSVAGSPRFGVYGVDFGWGRPAKVEMPGIEKTGAMALFESREGDGGIEVGLALPTLHMAKFSSLFAAGLEDLNVKVKK